MNSLPAGSPTDLPAIEGALQLGRRPSKENRRDAHAIAVDFISQTIGHGFHGMLGRGVLADSGSSLKSLRRVDEHDLSLGPDQERQKLLNQRIRPDKVGGDLTGKDGRFM